MAGKMTVAEKLDKLKEISKFSLTNQYFQKKVEWKINIAHINGKDWAFEYTGKDLDILLDNCILAMNNFEG